ncbi:bacterial Ig-like domain-containing protein [Enterococcus hirae]|nr:bacterial Ig-like domain-containing protein [Enterococcus hirae]MCH1976537.1 bacterial Ig-like domain-containing protein [Enterococcus hirae]
MYCPIAVKDIALTLKTNQVVSDGWFRDNIGALRNPDTGDDLLVYDKGIVQITAINAQGTAVALSDITKIPGTYTVSYAYHNESVQTTVTVKGAHIETKDLTIGTGDAWKAQDNFVRATDADDQPIGFDQLTVTGAGQVNVNQPGSYSVTYAYQTASQTAKVNVIDVQTQKIAPLDLNAAFDVYAGLKSVTNVDQITHTDHAYFQAQVSVKGVQKGTTTPIDLTTFTHTAGTYTIIYTYAGISRSVDVIVEKKALTDSSVFPAILDFENISIQYQTDNVLVGKENSQPASGSIQLTDTRSETGEGYKIKVTQNQPFIGKNTTASLSSASLSFKTGTATNSEHYAVTGGNQNIHLVPGQEQVILAAETGKSRGQTTMVLTDFHLTVPKDAEKRKDTYQSTLTWTLSDTP